MKYRNFCVNICIWNLVPVKEVLTKISYMREEKLRNTRIYEPKIGNGELGT